MAAVAVATAGGDVEFVEDEDGGGDGSKEDRVEVVVLVAFPLLLPLLLLLLLPLLPSSPSSELGRTSPPETPVSGDSAACTPAAACL